MNAHSFAHAHKWKVALRVSCHLVLVEDVSNLRKRTVLFHKDYRISESTDSCARELERQEFIGGSAVSQ